MKLKKNNSPFLYIENKLFKKWILFQEKQKEISEKEELNIVSIFSNWKKKYFQNDEINLSNSYKYLNSNELKEFHENIKTMLKEIPIDFKNEYWISILKNYLYKENINKIQILSLYLKHEIELINHKNKKEFIDFLHSQHILASSLAGYFIYLSHSKTIEIETIKKKNFSSSYYKDSSLMDPTPFIYKMNQYINDFHEHTILQIKQNIASNKSFEIIIRTLKKKIDVYNYIKCKSLIDENQKIISISFLRVLIKYNIKRYMFISSKNDLNDLCRNLHGKMFSISEYEIGVTAPPLHQDCRSVISPIYLENNDYENKKDLNYISWKKKYLK